VSYFKKAFLVILGIVFLSGIVSAQARTGQIYGIVTDEDGNPLPGVSVEATSPKLIGKATAVTDASGNYRLFALPAGEYKVVFTLQGFKPLVRENIVIHIEETIKVDVAMVMGALEEEVTVVGKSPLIDVKSTVKGMTLTKDMFEVLPRGRNFDTLVTAVPGVNQEPWLGGLSVDGASGAENMFYMDGSDITTTDTGVRGQSAAFEFVEEVQIKASGYPAEFGGALGGVVSVVTRQGGNEYHGELIFYYEGSRLRGKERDTLRLSPFDNSIAEYVNYQDLYGKDRQDRYEGGFSLGGYIFKDRLWFFGSFLPVYRKTVRTIDFLSTDQPDNLDYTENYYWYNFQAKLTAQPIGFMRFGVSYVNNFSKYKGRLPPRDGTGSIDDVWPDYGYSYPNYTVQGFADFTFGNNFMVNLRGGRFYTNTSGQQVHSNSPRQLMTGDGPGVFSDIPAEYQKVRGWQNHARIYETEKDIKYKNHFDADFTYYLRAGGEHAIKAGFQWVRQGEDEDSRVNMDFPEVYFYWNRPIIVGGTNYGRGKYGYYEVRGNEATGRFGGFWNVYNNRYALYLQDAWTIAERFTLNVGLRAETEYLPPYAAKESLPPGFENWKAMNFQWNDKLAPRIGFIYDVFGDASLKIFGSYGLYYDVIKTYMAANAYSGFKWKSGYYYLDTYEWTDIGFNGYFPGTLALIYDWRAPSFESTDPDLRPVSNREISFGLEKMLMENVSATVRFVQKHLRYTIEDVGVITPTGEEYYEANPGYGFTLHEGNGTGKMSAKYPETPKAKREYYAVNFAVDKRLSNNWLGGFSYTWSKLTGNYSGLASSDEFGRVAPYVERSFDNWAMTLTKDGSYVNGVLPTDRTHFFKLYAAYTFPFRLTLGTVLNAMSGVPNTETWSLLSAYQYPFDRGNVRAGTSGSQLERTRTPFLWFANFYAEYNLRLGKNTLNFNINVDNLFDTATARRIYNYRTLYQLDVSEDDVLANNYDLEDADVGYVLDDRYGKKLDFYDPIAVRFGVKFIF
jgi:hypothetical protein